MLIHIYLLEQVYQNTMWGVNKIIKEILKL